MNFVITFGFCVDDGSPSSLIWVILNTEYCLSEIYLCDPLEYVQEVTTGSSEDTRKCLLFYVLILSMKRDTERASRRLHTYVLTLSYILCLMQTVCNQDDNVSALCVRQNQ
jgi:hypothetical protein